MVYYLFGIIPNGTQGLLLALYLGITLAGFRGPYGIPGFVPGSVVRQGALPAIWTIFLKEGDIEKSFKVSQKIQSTLIF